MAWFPCCCECDACDFCSDGCMPEEMQVDLSCFSDTAFCSNCDEDANGSYVVSPFLSECSRLYGGQAFENECNFGSGKSGPQITVVVSKPTVNYLITITVVINHLFATTTVTYVKNYGTTKPDCRTLSGESLTRTSVSSPFGNVCDVNTDPAILTAL